MLARKTKMNSGIVYKRRPPEDGSLYREGERGFRGLAGRACHCSGGTPLKGQAFFRTSLGKEVFDDALISRPLKFYFNFLVSCVSIVAGDPPVAATTLLTRELLRDGLVWRR